MMEAGLQREFLAGWHEVGKEDEGCGTGGSSLWPRHWRYLDGFAVKGADDGSLYPFLTFDLLMDVCSKGRYRMAMLAEPERLRAPDDIVGDAPPPDGPYGRVLTTLTWAEADVLCRLAGGRLASQGEAELLCRDDSLMLGASGWTSDRWSDWDVRLLAFGVYDTRKPSDPDWFAARDRSLPFVSADADAAFRAQVANTHERRGTHRQADVATTAAAWLVVPR